jgi:plastocyanin
MMATACGDSSPMSPTSVGATITSDAFMPNPINIPAGSTVTWTNSDTTAHSIAEDGGAFTSDAIAPGGQYSFTFPSPGTVTYHDVSRPSMVGTVNVSAASSTSPPY